MDSVKKLYTEESIINIADAIRNKLGTQDKFYVSDMADAILGMSIDINKIICCTQSEYNEMAAHDSDTMYRITTNHLTNRIYIGDKIVKPYGLNPSDYDYFVCDTMSFNTYTRSGIIFFSSENYNSDYDIIFKFNTIDITQNYQNLIGVISNATPIFRVGVYSSTYGAGKNFHVYTHQYGLDDWNICSIESYDHFKISQRNTGSGFLFTINGCDEDGTEHVLISKTNFQNLSSNTQELVIGGDGTGAYLRGYISYLGIKFIQ